MSGVRPRSAADAGQLGGGRRHRNAGRAVLRPHGEISGYAYLVLRTIEGVVLAVGILLLLLLIPLGAEYTRAGTGDASAVAALARVVQEGNLYAYHMGMITVSAAGLVFCRVLFRARLVPRFLAAWGLVGYVALLTGSVLEVLGYGVGLVPLIPGGLFEVALGGLLLVRGFPVRAPDRALSPA